MINKEQIKKICYGEKICFGKTLLTKNEKNFYCISGSNIYELNQKIKHYGYKMNILYDNDLSNFNSLVELLKNNKYIFWPNLDSYDLNEDGGLRYIFDIKFFIPIIHFDSFCQIIADSINNQDKYNIINEQKYECKEATVIEISDFFDDNETPNGYSTSLYISDGIRRRNNHELNTDLIHLNI